MVCWRALGEDVDGSGGVDNSFRYEASVRCDLRVFIVLIHIPDETLALCQMADNYTELRESHFYSRCDVTRPVQLR